MTTYKIETNSNGEIFVVALHGLTTGQNCGGPYKNEESAKRRIRDLKRKDAEAAATAPENAIEPGPKFTIPTLPSSEWDYGGPFTFRQLGQPLSEFTTHRTFATPEMVAHARRPMGVYPAVAKKFYRQQWH